MHFLFIVFLNAHCLILQLEVLFLPHILCRWTGLFDGCEFYGVKHSKQTWRKWEVMLFIMLISVCQAPWFWNLRECWVQYPLQVKKPFLQFVCLSCRIMLGWFWLLLVFNSQVMERAHYWYYMLELGFYLSLLLRISVDVRRKVKTGISSSTSVTQHSLTSSDGHTRWF